MLILSLAELATILIILQICPLYSLRIPHKHYKKKTCTTALLLINTHLHYSTILMLTPTTNSSRTELGESVIFQPVLQAYPIQHSWIITAHVSLGNLECHWKTFNSLTEHNNYFDPRICIHQPQPSYYQCFSWNYPTSRTYTTLAKQP